MGEKRGGQKFFQNLRGEPKPYTLCRKAVKTKIYVFVFDRHDLATNYKKGHYLSL